MWDGNQNCGFSTIELLIALALMVTIIAAALDANNSAYYWLVSAVTAHEALVKIVHIESNIRLLAESDFEMVSTTDSFVSKIPTDFSDDSCRAGGLCYVYETKVRDVSQCAKVAELEVSWRVSKRYATSSVNRNVLLVQPDRMLSLGGDCLLRLPKGNWHSGSPILISQATRTPQFVTALDSVADRVYVIASSSPQLSVYQLPTHPEESPLLVATSSVSGKRLNAIDVVREMSSGRRYAYLLQHTLTEQLVVMDVTSDASLEVVASKTLVGVDGGSFPQGWRLMVYGKRLYVVTRETAGPELHIFSLTNFRNPIELSSGQSNLGRTVNDFVVREQRIDGVLRRFIFMAASAALKEFTVWDVTNDTPIEVVVINMPGSEDASSLSLSGEVVYVGRKNSPSGAELFVYDIVSLLKGHITPLATAEVGADVLALKAVGDVLFLNTNKSGAEFQIWHHDYVKWNPLVANAGRISYRSQPRLLPLGLEVEQNYVYLLSQSFSQPEVITVVSAP